MRRWLCRLAAIASCLLLLTTACIPQTTAPSPPPATTTQLAQTIEITIWPQPGGPAEAYSITLPVAALDVEGKTQVQVVDIMIHRISQLLRKVLNAEGP